MHLLLCLLINAPLLHVLILLFWMNFPKRKGTFSTHIKVLLIASYPIGLFKNSPILPSRNNLRGISQNDGLAFDGLAFGGSNALNGSIKAASMNHATPLESINVNEVAFIWVFIMQDKLLNYLILEKNQISNQICDLMEELGENPDAASILSSLREKRHHFVFPYCLENLLRPSFPRLLTDRLSIVRPHPMSRSTSTFFCNVCRTAPSANHASELFLLPDLSYLSKKDFPWTEAVKRAMKKYLRPLTFPFLAILKSSLSEKTKSR